MNHLFPNGVYPVMLTPFTEDNKIDYKSLMRLIDWYLDNGVQGLFAVCQSSEMFFLSLKERKNLAKFIVDYVDGKVPILVSGHVSESLEDQVEELNCMSETGADAIIMITNRLSSKHETEETWLSNLQIVLDNLPQDIPLGFYECPFPYKRLISNEALKWCASSGRFYFLKDTCCNLDLIKTRLEIIKDSKLKLYNANTSTLLDSLYNGANGFSGVMANFHPDLYSWLISSYKTESIKAKSVSQFLTVTSMIEMQVYPVNAKYFQKSIGNFSSIKTRVKEACLFDKRHESEVNQLIYLNEEFKTQIGIN